MNFHRLVRPCRYHYIQFLILTFFFFQKISLVGLICRKPRGRLYGNNNNNHIVIIPQPIGYAPIQCRRGVVGEGIKYLQNVITRVEKANHASSRGTEVVSLRDNIIIIIILILLLCGMRNYVVFELSVAALPLFFITPIIL